MEKLEGKFIIRLIVSWEHEKLLNKGNLVIYARRDTVNLKPIANSNS